MGMMVNKMLNKINVKVAPYALLDVLRALYNSDVKEVTITKEDNDLVLVVDTSRNFNNNGCGCTIEYDENGFIKSQYITANTTISSGGVFKIKDEWFNRKVK